MAEVNTSFYAPLKPAVTRVWEQCVAANPGFQFTVKLGRTFTHDRVTGEAEVDEFKKGIRPLFDSGRLGCLLMQFPWSFRYARETREHFIALRRAFRQFPLVAEMRHDSWLAEEAIATFIDHHVGFCNIDQPDYARAMPPTAYLTSGIGYVRLHGRNRAGWFESGPGRRARQDYLYSEEELVPWTRRIQRVGAHASKVFVIGTNDVGGKSLVNAMQIRTMMGQAVRVPPELYSAFPRELGCLQLERPVQREMPFVMPERAVA